MATVQAPGLLVPHAAASSQHGFTVKASIPPIREASQAEERGDGGSPAVTAVPAEAWRFGHSSAGARRGSHVSSDFGVGRDGGGSGGMPPLAQLHIARPAQQPVDQMAVGSPSVEVVGLHSSKGTRRLVKAVVRGLRACQVLHGAAGAAHPAWCFLARTSLLRHPLLWRLDTLPGVLGCCRSPRQAARAWVARISLKMRPGTALAL